MSEMQEVARYAEVLLGLKTRMRVEVTVRANVQEALAQMNRYRNTPLLAEVVISATSCGTNSCRQQGYLMSRRGKAGLCHKLWHNLKRGVK